MKSSTELVTEYIIKTKIHFENFGKKAKLSLDFVEEKEIGGLKRREETRTSAAISVGSRVDH